MAHRNYDDDYYYPPTHPITTKGGLKAHNQRGNFAQNWWAERWILALERMMDPGRLSRGRSYARKGQVLSINETDLGIEAQVQGSQRSPYKVQIQITHLTDVQWDQVVNALAEQAIFTAQLLAGEMPQNIEQAFQAAGVSLFPEKRIDLITNCSCPDYANPCKHIAATHYILGELFDEDPFMIFRLRGRTQEQILQELRQRRTGELKLIEEDINQPEIGRSLEESLDNFWGFGKPIDNISISVHQPTIKMPLLKRLGEAAFISEPGFQTVLQDLYDVIEREAVKTAFHEIVDEHEQ